MDVAYKRCRASAVIGLLFPVYAGEDGSIIVFNSIKKYWQQLKQTYDTTNGFWVTSVPKAAPQIGEKPRSEIDVHTLICKTWKGEPTPPRDRVDHKNGNPDDNSATNLEWTDALGNANNVNARDQQFSADFAQVIIDCQRLRLGSSALASVSIKKLDGTLVPATEILGPGKGRPLTRLSSLLVALSREPCLTLEKMKRRIDAESIIRRDSLTDEMTVGK